ncbi:MAG: glycosyltransferase, partial [Deltaproteobacteria bacterium]|nr:glycosyltransferase [Deltaproteobacteria bacterium]
MSARQRNADYSLPPRLMNASSSLEGDKEPIGKHLTDRFEEAHTEIGLLESALGERDGKIAQIKSILKQREFEQINQHAKLKTLTRKLSYKETRIQSLENELDEIHKVRLWKFLRAYAKLKSLFRTNPGTAFRRTSQKIQMDGLFATIIQGGAYFLGKNKPNAPHNVLKLPLPHDYEAYLSIHLPCLHQLLSQRQEILTWEDRPLISLIMPIYNTRIQWLKDLLSSVSNQTYDRWEALLVDDHSTSFETIALLREQTKKDPRFKLMERTENGGVAAACQEGLKAASGLFAAVVDHDDILEPDALYHVVSRLRSEPNVDLIYSDEILMDINGKIKQAVFRPDYSYNRLLSHPYIVHLTVFRRALALQVGGFDRSYETSQDYDLLLRLAAVTDRFAHVPRVLYRWRQHAESMGHQ